MEIRAYRPGDEGAVVALWQECGLTRPWNDARRDIARKLLVQPELFLIGTLNGELIATVMAGYEGHRGWVNYLAVAPRARGRGWGRALMERVEQLLKDLGCPKVNIQLRSSNADVVAFYRAVGYAPEEIVSLGKRLIPDGGSAGLATRSTRTRAGAGLREGPTARARYGERWTAEGQEQCASGACIRSTLTLAVSLPCGAKDFWPRPCSGVVRMDTLIIPSCCGFRPDLPPSDLSHSTCGAFTRRL